MFTLNSELRDFVRNNPNVASLVIVIAVNGQDPNEYAIEQYEALLKEAKRAALYAPLPKREHFPEGELGDTIYHDIRAQYFVNQRVFDIEQAPLEGRTFGDMIRNWREELMKDNTIAELSKSFSQTSLDFEQRNIALATHRVI
ncbi:hypothetical protein STRATTON_153 [Erwinia phage vB_EamM_Stratton]|uniref:Uncharacterized protein n=2 Tax=Erskinevirus EaH2 TaxID=2169883 RepID=A0A1B2IH41_9CAUD|nr:hypothetical protein G173_gp056 [Erwinia phage phiEaH2]AFQ96601.1 hypothetical protein [Erwinia phage phiEaH2]ANZ50578.1 hypothetical protein STRATTON_153 [Erwinia phage vB_EamM_Stratton]